MCIGALFVSMSVSDLLKQTVVSCHVGAGIEPGFPEIILTVLLTTKQPHQSPNILLTCTDQNKISTNSMSTKSPLSMQSLLLSLARNVQGPLDELQSSDFKLQSASDAHDIINFWTPRCQ